MNGTYTPKAVDQEKLTVLTLEALIVSWPFAFKRDSSADQREDYSCPWCYQL